MPESLERDGPPAVQSSDVVRPDVARLPLLDRVRTLLAQEAGPVAFVWLIWLVQSWLLLDFVRENGMDIPFMDEWEMIPALTGQQAFTVEWLWSQHNEHRIVIPRLLYLVVTKLSGTSFKTGMVVDALLLSGVCAALMVSARKLRGRTHYADAFFPLLLLHFAQAENLLWSFQIVFVSSAAVSMCVLCALLRPGPPTRSGAIFVGVCSVLLPLFGGHGVALVPAFSLVTLALAWDLRRDPRQAPRSWRIVFALGLASIAVTLLYFVGFKKNEGHPASPNMQATLDGVLQILSLGFGSASKLYWPLNQRLTLGALLATAGALAWVMWQRREERMRALRLSLFMGGLMSLVCSIAWARVGVYPLGIVASRYTTLVAPLLCAAYLAWELLKRPQLARFAQMMLFMFAALMLMRNRDVGLADAIFLRAGREAALNDIHNKVPLSEVARRHCGALYLCTHLPVLTERMLLLHERKIGDFADANPN